MAKAKTGSSVSALLKKVIQKLEDRPHVPLAELIEMLKQRVFGMSILIFCIPNCLPIPNVAGLSAITGVPIILVGFEMLIGRTQLWLPDFLGRRQLPAKKLAAIFTKALPSIQWVEKLLHPRLAVFSSPLAERLLGLAFIGLAVVMSLPIPFGNLLPGAAMALMAIGLITRDGAAILLGLLLGMATLAFVLVAGDYVLGLWFQ